MIPLRDDNPTTHPPVITIGLICVTILAFFWQLSLGSQVEQAIRILGATPAELLGKLRYETEPRYLPPELTIVSSLFLHGGWMHLIGNMLFLWIFGNNVEDAMGHSRFLIFYFLCGAVAVLAQALPAPESTIPMIGASGSISGVLGAYLLLYPHARVLVLIPLGFLSRVIYLPAMVVLGFWFLLQLLSAFLSDPNQPGVAFGAHVGGFVAGMVLVVVFRRRGVSLFNPPPSV
jgi:membrane associated rhomboid family serine protease